MEENIMLRPDYRANIRHAIADAKWTLRVSEREFGGFRHRDVLVEIDKCRWIAERIRIEGLSMPPFALICLHQQLLNKLSFIEVAAIKYLGIPAPTARYSK